MNDETAHFSTLSQFSFCLPFNIITSPFFVPILVTFKLMIKNQSGDIYFKDWQEHYGYDTESIVKKPSAKILKKVTEK